MGDDDEVPRFDPNGTRYDSSSYAGRLRNILSAINPATLLLSDAEVAASQARLRAFRGERQRAALGG